MKIFYTLLTAFIVVLYFAAPVSAADTANELGIDVSGIESGLDPDTADVLEDNGITVDNTDAMTGLSAGDVLGYIWSSFKKSLTKPLAALASLLGVILAASVTEGLEDSTSNKGVSKIFGVICVMTAVGIISGSVQSTMDKAADALNSGGTFMLGYVPVFAAVTASSGSVTSAAVYNALLLTVSEASVQLSEEVIVPALSVCMALGIVEAINPDLKLSGMTEAVKKAVSFLLGFIMTVFLGLLSLQSIVGASADTVGVKAAKYVVSSVIPVVGSAVADAYGAVRSSLGLLRGGVGFVGIAAIFVMLIPPLLDVLAMRLVFAVADIAAGLFGVTRVKILVKNAGWIFSALFSILVCFGVMLIISTAILMLVGLNIS